MEHNYHTPTKEQTEIPPKNHNQSREGDWICFNCNNLNFSFRKKCNRCKIQTRKQNQQMQSTYAYYYYQQPYQYGNEEQFTPYVADPNQNIYEPQAFQQNGEQKENIDPNYAPQHKIIHGNQRSVIGHSPLQQIHCNQIMNQQSSSSKKKSIKRDHTPSNTKKHQVKSNFLELPSVSPLLKKYMATQGKKESSDPNISDREINVALFYDKLWDSNVKIESNADESAQKDTQKIKQTNFKTRDHNSKTKKKVCFEENINQNSISEWLDFDEENVFIVEHSESSRDDEEQRVDLGWLSLGEKGKLSSESSGDFSMLALDIDRLIV